MALTPALPTAAAPFVSFATLLRRHGFVTSSDQTVVFLSAVELLGPSSMESVRQAAHATMGPPPERRQEFDALFRAHFYGDVATAFEAAEQDITLIHDPASAREAIVAEGRSRESGHTASGSESLFDRRFDQRALESLRRLNGELTRRLPRRRAFRRSRRKRGTIIDIRKSLASVVRNDGDIVRPIYSVRQMRPRNLVVLIDISGSMKRHTDEYLRFAHALKRQRHGVEVFTLGTRLTRISAALASPQQRIALEKVSRLVQDWDGGTRLGSAISAFLATPRFVNFVRGAAVMVLSDALERGDFRELQFAVHRLRRLAWRLSWATPLAADPEFRPHTMALKALLPELDDLVNGGDVVSLVNFTLELAQPAPSAEAIWSKQSSR